MSRPAAPACGRVTLHVAEGVATLVLDRPAKHNALTPEMLDELDALLGRLDADRETRVVVVAGAGERSFCAGADIHRFKGLEPLEMWATWTRRGLWVLDRLAGLRQPTIAAVHGDAFGGGLELALACDLRVVAAEAKLGLTEVGLGTTPGWGGTGRLPALVGAARAKQMVFTAEALDAARAAEWGLATRVVPAGQVAGAAHELALAIAAHAPVAVQMAKQAIDAGHAFRLMEPVVAASTAFTADAAEGFAAFAAKRPPHFTGS